MMKYDPTSGASVLVVYPSVVPRRKRPHGSSSLWPGVGAGEKAMLVKCLFLEPEANPSSGGFDLQVKVRGRESQRTNAVGHKLNRSGRRTAHAIH